MESFLSIFLLVTFGSLLGLFGGIIVLFNKRLSSLISSNAIPLAAGVLLAAAFLDILPEALEGNSVELILLVVLFSILSGFFIENFLFKLHHHEGQTGIKSAIPLVIIGDTVHNAIDGVTIAAAFLIDPKLGILVAIATFLHEIPQEIGDFGIMLRAGWKKLNIVLLNLFSAAFAYIGAFLVLIFSTNLDKNLGIVLAVAAGMFIYLSASDFLPQTEKDFSRNPIQQTLWIFGGAILMWLVGVILSRLYYNV